VNHLATLGVRPPEDPRDRVHTGRFLRALLGRWLVVSVLVWVLVAAVTDVPTWVLIAGGASTALLAADVLWLTYRVRRDERRVPGR
jgi:hypothetical protein